MKLILIIEYILKRKFTQQSITGIPTLKFTFHNMGKQNEQISGMQPLITNIFVSIAIYNLSAIKCSDSPITKIIYF